MISGGHFDIDSKINESKKIESELANDNIWENIERANNLKIKLTSLRKNIDDYNEIFSNVKSSIELLDIIEENSNEVNELEENLVKVNSIYEKLEIENFLSGKYDDFSCFLEIHPGAGGTEACDWASMLLRMYQMFCDKNGYHYEIIDVLSGEEAGIKSVTLKIAGNHAYGYFKGEQGVHRLVRISPFDANKRRHTSFAAVTVIPVIETSENVVIKPDDIRVDVYRSSGKGGQGVNTTDSAVRITHIPTGIVVTCQNERSQIQNKATAMSILTSKLETLILENNERDLDKLKSHVNIEFGSQIRNYTLEPYKLVKDTRTGYESVNADAVLDGNILGFMESIVKRS